MLASKDLLTIVSPCIRLGHSFWNGGSPNKNQIRSFSVHFAISKTIFDHLKNCMAVSMMVPQVLSTLTNGLNFSTTEKDLLMGN